MGLLKKTNIVAAIVALTYVWALPTLAVSPLLDNTFTLEVDAKFFVEYLPGEATSLLTRCPSVERSDDIAAIGSHWGQTNALNLDDQQESFFMPPETASAPEYPAGNCFFARFAQLARGVVLLARFLLNPLNAQRGRRCGGYRRRDRVVGSDTGAHLGSPLGKLKSAFHKSVTNGKRFFQDLVKRTRNMFHDPATWTVRMVKLANAFSVFDLPARSDHKRHDSEFLFETDRTRLEASDDVALGIQFVCRETAIIYPEIGYNQGFDASCKAIFLTLDSDIDATFAVFTKWAVPVAWLLCHHDTEHESSAKKAVKYVWSIIKQHAPTVFWWLSRDAVVGSDDDTEMTEGLFEHVFFEPLVTFCARLGLRKAVFRRVMEHTMMAGVHGSAITMYVVLCLLCLTDKRGVRGSGEGVMIKARIRTVAQSVRSFSVLEKVAPLSLAAFVREYRAEITDISAASWP